MFSKKVKYEDQEIEINKEYPIELFEHQNVDGLKDYRLKDTDIREFSKY